MVVKEEVLRRHPSPAVYVAPDAEPEYKYKLSVGFVSGVAGHVIRYGTFLSLYFATPFVGEVTNPVEIWWPDSETDGVVEGVVKVYAIAHDAEPEDEEDPESILHWLDDRTRVGSTTFALYGFLLKDIEIAFEPFADA